MTTSKKTKLGRGGGGGGGGGGWEHPRTDCTALFHVLIFSCDFVIVQLKSSMSKQFTASGTFIPNTRARL